MILVKSHIIDHFRKINLYIGWKWSTTIFIIHVYIYVYNIYLFIYIWYMLYVVNENWILVNDFANQPPCFCYTMCQIMNITCLSKLFYKPKIWLAFFSIYIPTYYYLPRYLLLIKQFKKGKYVIKWVTTHVTIPKQHICKFQLGK